VSPTRHMYPAGPHQAHQPCLHPMTANHCHPPQGSSNHPQATNNRCHGPHQQQHHHEYSQSNHSQSCPPTCHMQQPPPPTTSNNDQTSTTTMTNTTKMTLCVLARLRGGSSSLFPRVRVTTRALGSYGRSSTQGLTHYVHQTQEPTKVP
jgi:hypothetical protein